MPRKKKNKGQRRNTLDYNCCGRYYCNMACNIWTSYQT